MKNDQILLSIIGFIVPVISLCGIFVALGFFINGFSAIIHSAILFAVALMLMTLKSYSASRIAALINLEYVSFFIYLLGIFYLSGVLLLLL